MEHVLTCRLVGVAVHYLTLCNLLWMLISVNVILQAASNHKQRLSNRANTASNAPSTLLRPSSKMQQQPITNRPVATRPSVARHYLLGWGLGLAAYSA